MTTPASGAEVAPVGAERTDAELAAAGDAYAFERLYRAHVVRIHSLARRMMGTDQAADLTQDIFVRAWEKLATFRGDAAFGTWLYRLAINVILNRRASRSWERSRVEDPEAVLATVPSPRGVRDTAVDFEGAVEQLPDGARTVFVLHDVEGYKHEEIATWMGVTVGTTKAQLHRARMLLRRHLSL